MSASTTEASVITLTAEVRTLVVGSRQITLSVAKQLDVVPLADLDVWGRVKLTGDVDRVIGVDRSGNLALASYHHRVSGHPPHIVHSDLGGEKVIVCGKAQPTTYTDEYRLNLNGRTFTIAARDVNKCGIHGGYGGIPGECDGWDPKGHVATIEAIIKSQIDARLEEERLNEAAKSAPLIVLAGLK